MRNRKVLIIPSWYPTVANPLTGSFFREQALLVQDLYDLKVLYGFKNYIGYKRYYYQQLKKQLTRNDRLFRDHHNPALAPPAALTFQFPFIPAFKEARNFDIMVSAYEKELTYLMEQGWTPDLIHAHSTVDAGLVACALGKKFGIPVIITEHQVFLLHQHSRFLQQKIFQALESVQQVAAVSNHQMRSILMHNIHCSPVVIGNHIDENLYALKARKNQGRFKILAVTYPSPIKDVETFFQAIGLLVAKGHRDIAVTVIGNNSFQDLQSANVNVFRDLAGKYGVAAYCQLLSYVPRENLPAQHQAHDVFVSTSIAETFGVAICEALATGMPVVATASGGVDDTLTPRNGIKVPIKDPEAIAQALIRIKTGAITFNPQQVRDSVVNKYGNAAFRQKLQHLYEQAIKLGAPGLHPHTITLRQSND